jgi:hypothetical protein
MYESIYIIHTVYLLFALVTLVAIWREVHYKGQIYRNITEVLGRMHRYKTLSFKNSAWFKIHIKD